MGAEVLRAPLRPSPGRGAVRVRPPEEQEARRRPLDANGEEILTQAEQNEIIAEQMIKSQTFACIYCFPILLTTVLVLL